VFTEYAAHFKVPRKDNIKNVPPGYYARIEAKWAGRTDYIARYLNGERVPLGRSTCVFNREMLLKALEEWSKPPIAVGYLDTDKETKKVVFRADSSGPLRIWEWPKAMNKARYCLGMDAGRGLRDGDPSCGIVGSRVNGHMVAEWHGHLNPRRFGQEMARLGRYYNEAFIVPEVEPSSDGRTACNSLEETGYFNIYQPYNEKRILDVEMPTYGLPMHRVQKVRVIGYAREVVDEHRFLIPSRELILELLGFVEKPPKEGQREGKLEGDEGFCDDRSIAYVLMLEGLYREGLWTPPPEVGAAPRWMVEMSVRMQPSSIGNRSWMAA
jgi:hypothetical protein